MYNNIFKIEFSFFFQISQINDIIYNNYYFLYILEVKHYWDGTNILTGNNNNRKIPNAPYFIPLDKKIVSIINLEEEAKKMREQKENCGTNFNLAKFKWKFLRLEKMRNKTSVQFVCFS